MDIRRVASALSIAASVACGEGGDRMRGDDAGADPTVDDAAAVAPDLDAAAESTDADAVVLADAGPDTGADAAPAVAPGCAGAGPELRLPNGDLSRTLPDVARPRVADLGGGAALLAWAMVPTEYPYLSTAGVVAARLETGPLALSGIVHTVTADIYARGSAVDAVGGEALIALRAPLGGGLPFDVLYLGADVAAVARTAASVDAVLTSGPATLSRFSGTTDLSHTALVERYESSYESSWGIALVWRPEIARYLAVYARTGTSGGDPRIETAVLLEGGAIEHVTRLADWSSQIPTGDLAWDGVHAGIVWDTREPGGATSVHFALLDETGAPTGVGFERAGSEPRIAWGGGRFAMVWNDRDDVVMTLVGPDGAVIEDVGVAVSAARAFSPDVAWVGDAFLVAWADERTSIGSSEIFARRMCE
jgi:hypothetical protein